MRIKILLLLLVTVGMILVAGDHMTHIKLSCEDGTNSKCGNTSQLAPPQTQEAGYPFLLGLVSIPVARWIMLKDLHDTTVRGWYMD